MKRLYFNISRRFPQVREEAWTPWVAPYTDSVEDAKSVSLQAQLALL